MGPRPGLVHAGHDPIQESPTLFFVSPQSPTRCYLVCAYSGEHARALVKAEFPDFNEFNSRVIRLQRGIREEYGVQDAYDIAEAHQPKNQNPVAKAIIAAAQE